MDREAWQATVHGVARTGLDLATRERERERERAIVIYTEPFIVPVSRPQEKWPNQFC